MTTTQEELIRHRIEKRLSGRRDLFLHLLVYVLVMVLVWISVPWWELRALALFGVLWAIPLALNVLRYYYQCGPGISKRAEAIDQELERYLELTSLDDEEELLIEDRVARKFKARRLVVAHLLVMLPMLAVLWLEAITAVGGMWNIGNLIDITQIWGIAFLMHWLRFYFVHGRGPAGRALKIEKELERQWHLSRDRRHERRLIFEASNDVSGATVDLDRVREGQSLITADGELVDERILLDEASEAQADQRGASR